MNARVAEGRTRLEMAVESGHPKRALTAYLRRVYGMQAFETLTESTRQRAREQVAAGQSRGEVAAELGVSGNTVAKYTLDEPGVYERRFQEHVDAVSTWPAATGQITDACFGGDLRQAQGWCDGQVKYGRLRRVRPGWHDVTRDQEVAAGVQVGSR